MSIWVSLVLLAGGCTKDDGPAPDDFEAAFEQLWGDFDQTYSYFSVKGVDWDSIYDTYRPQVVNGQTSQSELADVLSEMTLSLRDLHVVLFIGPVRRQYNNRSDYAANAPDHAVNYLSSVDFENKVLLGGPLDGLEAHYLRFKSLTSEGDFSQLEDVLSVLEDRAGLILDLRDNGGGNDAIARDFVERLTSQPRVFRRYRFRDGPNRDDFQEWRDDVLSPNNPIDFDGPIVLLTNRGTVSSAEGFTAMLKALPNTFHIGDTTRGSTGNPREFTLHNGWRYLVSSWQVALPDLQLIEDQGIAPDLAVMNSEESMAEGRDLILEAALDQLR